VQLAKTHGVFSRRPEASRQMIETLPSLAVHWPACVVGGRGRFRCEVHDLLICGDFCLGQCILCTTCYLVNFFMP